MSEPDDRLTGWFLGSDSWPFHREFFRRIGRPMEHGEYGFLLRQARSGAGERIGEAVFRLTMRDGAPIVVIASTGALKRVLRPDWTAEGAARARQRAAEAAELHRAPEPASPAPEPPPSRMRLGLASTQAAALLADRLRRQGIAA